jgi:hypothetical protein
MTMVKPITIETGGVRNGVAVTDEKQTHFSLLFSSFCCWNRGRPKGIELDVGVGELGRQFLVTDHTA